MSIGQVVLCAVFLSGLAMCSGTPVPPLPLAAQSLATAGPRSFLLMCPNVFSNDTLHYIEGGMVEGQFS